MFAAFLGAILYQTAGSVDPVVHELLLEDDSNDFLSIDGGADLLALS